MFVKEVTVENQVGLHARPATFFIQKANEFKSSIWVEKEERRVNAKSLLGVLSLGIVGGTTIRIIADGADEQAAVEGLIKLVNSGFSEEVKRGKPTAKSCSFVQQSAGRTTNASKRADSLFIRNRCAPCA